MSAHLDGLAQVLGLLGLAGEYGYAVYFFAPDVRAEGTPTTLSSATCGKSW